MEIGSGPNITAPSSARDFQCKEELGQVGKKGLRLESWLAITFNFWKVSYENVRTHCHIHSSWKVFVRASGSRYVLCAGGRRNGVFQRQFLESHLGLISAWLCKPLFKALGAHKRNFWVEASTFGVAPSTLLGYVKAGFCWASKCLKHFSEARIFKNTLLFLYVDNVAALSKTSTEQKFVASEHRRLYKIPMSESVNWFLEVKLQRVPNPSSGYGLLALSHPLYVKSVRRRLGSERTKTVCTSMIDSHWSSVSCFIDVQGWNLCSKRCN